MNETTRHVYDPATIEPRWQAVWDEQGTFLTPEAPEELAARPKFYVLDMFPYPSGAGLHVGHPVGYTATDVIARAKRMQGYNVLHPMGWDAFGLPAERAAVREGRHPAEITRRNIETFRRQIRRLGMSYDWRREVDTSSPDYYRWTQWIFLKLYERGLAYMAEMPVNWCPALGTVLANEEVQGGRYVETGDPVERRLMRQWMLRITAYAERLLDDLDRVDWPAHVKEIQRNWIGRSEGAEITFRVDGGDERFEVFTTCPETLFGCTFCVLSPEHPLVPRITAAGERGAVEAYRRDAAAKSELERTDLAVEKTGVATGAFAVHPITGDKVPIWVADYVLMTYGTGSIMAVPGHDERDHDFARRFGLEIVRVIEGGGRDIEDEAWVGGGAMVASDFLDGMTVAEAKERMIGWLEEHGAGRRKVEYRLRDWLFSRQRYWGEPFPIVHTDDGETVGVAEDELPVELPRIDEHRPTDDGRPPLARAGDGWLRVALSDGRRATRETNTMPQWAGSCWYYLRYLDPQNRERIFSSAAERYWMPVDLYVGGGEHAVLHLLYARFWHKVLYDCGLVHTNEPFQRLYTQAMMHADSYQRSGKYYPPHEVEERGGRYYAGGEEVVKKLEKMSKSKLNVVNPDDVVEVHGADALRLFELFMGPLNQPKVWPENWRTESLQGIDRFLQRTWRLVVDEATGERSPRLAEAPASSEPALERTLHKTIRKVTRDTEALAMNTAVAQMMVFVNEATASATLPVEAVKAFVRLLAPYAPHLAEELWHRLGEGAVIAHAPWPDYDEELASDDEITVVVQVDGKKRDELRVPAGVDRATLERLALDSKRVGEHLGGAAPARVVVVPGRLVNLVTA